MLRPGLGFPIQLSIRGEFQRVDAQAFYPGHVGKLLAALQDDATRRAVPPSSLSPQGFVEPLTPREVEVLRLIAAGLRNQEIADQLFISVATVKRHLSNIYGKLGVTHRTQAVARTQELDLL